MAIKLIQNLQTKKNGKCNRMKVKKQHKLCQCLKTQHVHTRVYVRVCVCVCVCVYIYGGGGVWVGVSMRSYTLKDSYMN